MNTLLFLLFLCQSCNLLPLAPSTNIIAPFDNIGDVTNEKISQFFPAVTFTPPFPDGGRKTAVLEQESLVSKADSAYTNLQQFVADLLHPKAVVDSIQESEKYGNDGEAHRAIATSFIGKVEAGSNLLNAAVDLPFQVASQFGKKITTSLNTVGGKLVGLAK